MPKLDPVDASFAETATHRVEVEHTIDAAPAQVWAVLSDHGSWDTWYPEMTRCETTEPGGLGATRTVKLGPLVADERWVIWEPDHALGFTVTRMNLPMARRVLEQLHLDAVPGDGPRTRVRYTGSYQPHLLSRLAFARTERRIASSWKAALVSLAEHVASSGSAGSDES